MQGIGISSWCKMSFSKGNVDDPSENFVIRACRLPWSATAEGVAEFFSGCHIRGGAKNGIHFTYSSEGRPSGECFVELVSREDLEKALAKSKNSLGKSFVEVFKSTAGEMEQTCQRMGQPQDRGHEAVVRLRGLPFQVSKEEIAQFFTGLEIVPNGITITLDEEGQTMGEAFVEFASIELASQAMEKRNQEFIFHRKIKIFKSSKADIENVSERKLKRRLGGVGAEEDRRKIKIFKSSKADIENVSERKLKRRLGGVGAEEDRRSRVKLGDQYKLLTRKDLPRGTKFAMLKNKQSMGASILRILGIGEVPAKPTGDVVDTETIYKMSRAPRGIAIIINNKNFLRSSGMDKYPRNGTDVDRDALEKLFEYLKFKVTIYNDVTADRMKQIAQEMASWNHSAYDAFIFSILTHGKEGLLYGTDGTISIRDLTSEFKDATTLAGKPKMFFFQACQGNRYLDGMDVPDGPDSEASSEVSVPVGADFLYAYSTAPGYRSWRNLVDGSWFIQSLTKVFEEKAERMDILRMLTRVSARVSTFKSRTGEYYSDNKRQVCSIVSRLRKDLYFFPEKVTGQN
ncbi:uncharacterized protein [Acropora muricata]|uniref:uncharacterized protein isoform X2 n=1 Tax=Acropora muricata TaxID=159855 RepID=UPI0034E40653